MTFISFRSMVLGSMSWVKLLPTQYRVPITKYQLSFFLLSFIFYYIYLSNSKSEDGT